jgi:hypothetical protein
MDADEEREDHGFRMTADQRMIVGIGIAIGIVSLFIQVIDQWEETMIGDRSSRGAPVSGTACVPAMPGPQ